MAGRGGPGANHAGLSAAQPGMSHDHACVNSIDGSAAASCRHGECGAEGEVAAPLLTGEASATLGISHLTTSRRHLHKPVLRAELGDGEVVLSGYSPWVTGGAKTDYLVTGAVLPDEHQLLVLVPTDHPGVAPRTPARLLALNGSCTGAVEFDDVRLSREWLLCEPADNVMQLGVGGRTGGLQTSTLALGLAKSAIDYLHRQALQRPELLSPADQLQTEWSTTSGHLLELAAETELPASAVSDLRAQSNSLVLRRRASRARGSQRSRLYRRSSGWSVVPRSAVLSRLELSSTGAGRQPVRAGRNSARLVQIRKSVAASSWLGPRKTSDSPARFTATCCSRCPTNG